MFDIITHSPAIAPSDDWRETLSWGDIVSFSFPVEGAGRPPKKRPCLVLDITNLGETRYAVLAYGTSADTSANRGYEVKLTETEARAAGLHRSTRFVGARRMLVALDHCGFVICAATGAPTIGRLNGDAFERMNVVRGRILAEAEMAADQRTRRRRALRLRHRRAWQRPVTVEHRTPRRRMTASRA
ncbi:hypothetical protein [Marivita sp. XM-24bin2]|jgi:hypothetical protein|uniref:hypothetical protein n=1 Tax=unclassified Marivita TaxID=2632480 RepID=UPI000D7AAA4E|nr:hypothetical protein [Marivita sp. XM-24bin2]MCR9111581.1 hypothetical protein [Paracoccaceae bacterium]PWL32734.1 MAG: hypothetical protein DCO97_21115 [Marivita sp. XM-24bin2]